MSTTLLSRRSHRTKPSLSVLGDIALPLARLHELCGPARCTLAMMVAAATQGPIFWIAPTWQGATLNPDGMVTFTGPERFTFLSPHRPEDILWCLEEVLRSGAVPLVIADIPGPPGLTAVRRLHLAAEAGATRGKGAPLGLILTPADGGAPGVETRWHMAPDHRPDQHAWHITRSRARTAPPKTWRLTGRPGAWHLSNAATPSAPHATAAKAGASGGDI